MNTYIVNVKIKSSDIIKGEFGPSEISYLKRKRKIIYANDEEHLYRILKAYYGSDLEEFDVEIIK